MYLWGSFSSTLGTQGWFLAVFCMQSLKQAWPSYWIPVLHVRICTQGNVQSHHKPCSEVVVGYLVCWGYVLRPQEDPSSTCSDHAIGWSTEMIFRVSGHDWARRSCPSVFWAPLSLENCLIKGGIPGRLWSGEHRLALFALFLHNISDSPHDISQGGYIYFCCDQTPNKSNLVG